MRLTSEKALNVFNVTVWRHIHVKGFSIQHFTKWYELFSEIRYKRGLEIGVDWSVISVTHTLFCFLLQLKYSKPPDE